MLQQLYRAKAINPVRGLDVVRIGVALIIVMHPLHGFANPNGIPHFGAYLSSLGYPFGVALAWSVLVLQTVASLALLANRFVVPACLGHIAIVTAGLIHYHRPLGWYAAGPGSQGMEWPVILLTSLVGLLWAYWPAKPARAA